MKRGSKWLVVGALVAAPLVFAAPPAARRAAFEEVAPGVFFALAAKEPAFEGSNAGFVVQDEQVVVIEGSLPGFARIVRDEVARRTDRPIRLVFDTHDHWDHSFGNGVLADAGAIVVAHARCAELLATRGAEAFAKYASSDQERERAMVADTRFAGASVAFDERLAIGRGARRIELLHLGRGHTRGDAVAWLPAERVLFTGDLCVNGAYNFMGDGDTASWIAVLDRLLALDPAIVCPGHGVRGGRELLEKQKRWLVELHAAVDAGLAAGSDEAAIAEALELPWYQEWTGVAAASRRENVAAVFGERTGRKPPLLLTEELGLTAEPTPLKARPGWKTPRKVVVVGEEEARVAWLARAAPSLELVAARDRAAALAIIADVDGLIGGVDAALLEKGTNLAWAQVGSAGVERYVGIPSIASGKVVLTNAQRLYGPEIADHALAMLLALWRGLPATLANQQGARAWRLPDDAESTMRELRGKTVLVAGLGGIGREVAQRAAAFGARVVATNPSGRVKPSFVERVEAPDRLIELAPLADALFVCVPLTRSTEKLVNEKVLAALRPGAVIVNVARGRCIDTAALVAALKSGRLGGAALDVTEPEPLPPDHELWRLKNVVITPHVAAASEGADERRLLLVRENLRRFAAGEALLSVVDPGAGY